MKIIQLDVHMGPIRDTASCCMLAEGFVVVKPRQALEQSVGAQNQKKVTVEVDSARKSVGGQNK